MIPNNSFKLALLQSLETRERLSCAGHEFGFNRQRRCLAFTNLRYAEGHGVCWQIPPLTPRYISRALAQGIPTIEDDSRNS